MMMPVEKDEGRRSKAMAATYKVLRFDDAIIEFRRNLTIEDAEAYAQSRSLWHQSTMVVMDKARRIVATFESGQRVENFAR
jgi:hypothetical protein